MVFGEDFFAASKMMPCYWANCCSSIWQKAEIPKDLAHPLQLFYKVVNPIYESRVLNHLLKVLLLNSIVVEFKSPHEFQRIAIIEIVTESHASVFREPETLPIEQ